MCISYDALACQVWLDPIAMAPAGGQPLCADHAQRLSAPRGWVILDRRTSQSTLMTAAGPAPAQDARGRAAVPRRRLPRAWGQFDAPRLEFLTEDDDAAAEPDPTFDVPAVATALLEPEPVEPEPEPELVESEPVEPEPELQAETVEFRAPEPEVAEPEPIVPEIHAERDAEGDVLHELTEPEPEPVVVAEPVVTELVEPEPVAVEPESAPAPKPVAKKAPARRGRAKAETGPLGKPKGRLLSRAFEASGPQRSAITESLDALDDSAAAPPAEVAEG